MIALGCDVSTKKVAIAGIREDGTQTHHTLLLDHNQRGARRLVEARSVAFTVLRGYRAECHSVMVEEAWKGDIQRIAIVVSEAAQAALPGALVWTASPGMWKRETIGDGAATKDVVMAAAQGLGYEGRDQDLADALVMAQCAWERWNRALGEAA